MNHLSRGVAAGATGLLVTLGLATAAAPAGAAATCTVSVATSPTPVAEGNVDGTNSLTFTVSGTPSNPNQCNGVTVNYTLGGTAEAGSDYTAPGTQQVALTSTGGPATITLPIIGDTTVEPDETATVTISPNVAYTIGTAAATATIQNDDAAAPPAATGHTDAGVATVSPSSGPAGTVITVTGNECDETTGSAVLVQVKGESGGPIAESMGNTVTDRAFTATLTVPADADPTATQYVRASCGAEAYADVPFDVTPAASGGTGSTGDAPTGANGYRMVAADGGIFTFGNRQFHGSTGDRTLNQPIVGGATDTSDYEGYWIVAKDGGVFAFDAEFYGSLGGEKLAAPAVEIEPTPTGKGYFIVLANGKVYTFGDANFAGDMAGKTLNKPIIGMSVTPTGLGYWLVAEDGGIFNFGDAKFFGSMGDKKLNAPIIDLAPAVDNQGYYLLGKDGGVFTFGSADFKGSTGAMTLNAPVIAMLVAPNGAGYWLAATDGGIFTFGAVDYLGSQGGTKLNSPVLDLIN